MYQVLLEAGGIPEDALPALVMGFLVSQNLEKHHFVKQLLLPKQRTSSELPGCLLLLFLFCLFTGLHEVFLLLFPRPV